MEDESKRLQDEYKMELLGRMQRLAEGRVNDTVKLAFLDGERMEEIDGLDLTALTEFKRSGNGTVELKLVNRLAVMERLVELLGGSGADGADAFFRALDQKAEGGGTLAP